MKFLLSLFFLAAALIGGQAEPAATPGTSPKKTLSWSELSQLPLPPPGKKIAYGKGPLQFGELRLPKGEGLFPVVVIVHGGCWMAAFDYVYMTRLATWLAERGYATWTIEYRRVGDKGGGWPGTFLDVAQATDYVRKIAQTEPLDTKRVFAAGHSAGGQLALWLATRARLPKESELYLPDPLPIRGVLGLAAVTDLAQYRIGPPDSCHGSVVQLMGGGPEQFPRRYAESSPRHLLPLGIPQVFIQGEADPIVASASVRAYVEAATRAGDRAVLLPLPGAGHFEAAVPLPPTEKIFERALRLLIHPAPDNR